MIAGVLGAALGAVLECGCTVRLINVPRCPRCRETSVPGAGAVMTWATETEPGQRLTLTVECWHCKAEYDAAVRVIR